MDDAASTITVYSYVGPGRVERRDLGNGTRLDVTYDGLANAAGDYGDRKKIRTLHTDLATSTVLDDRSYTWDRVGNKQTHRDNRLSNLREFTYDSAYRMTASTGSPSGSITYGLDGVNNRTSVVGGNDPGTYTLSTATPQPNDFPLNQYTISPTSSPAISHSYDENGNLTSGAGGAANAVMKYDYRNQMIEHRPTTATLPKTTYRYDALGRRIEKFHDDGVTTSTVRYFYDGWHALEETDEASSTTATYVYGGRADEVLAMHRAALDYFYHCDDQGTIYAVTDAAGAATERYNYEDYGEPLFFDGSDNSTSATAIGNPYLYTGRRLDAESNLYYYRTRYIDPSLGRFTTRDTIGIWGDHANRGNGCAYSANNPWSIKDPTGTRAMGPLTCEDQASQDQSDCAATAIRRHARTDTQLRQSYANAMAPYYAYQRGCESTCDLLFTSGSTLHNGCYSLCAWDTARRSRLITLAFARAIGRNHLQLRTESQACQTQYERDMAACGGGGGGGPPIYCP